MSNQEAEDRGNRELEVPENSVRNPAFEDSPSPSEDSSKGSGSLHGGPGSSESGSTQPPALYGPFRRPENSLPSSSKLVSISSNHQSEKKKRKNLRGVQDSVVSDAAIDAQQQEKERLDRLALKRPTAPTIANYFPVQTDATDVIELSDGSESDDDTPECLGVFYKSQIPNKTPTASEPPSKYTRIDAFRVADRKVAQARQEEQIRLARQNKKKKNDPESVERNAQGRLLINHDRPEEDPDVFVADHLTDVLKPHQLGGIRFLYDNIIETIKDFKDSPGFGCVLAHSMGLGKTLQIIEFVDIFLRTVDAKHVLIITPVNVIQNWLAEFDKWLPTTDEQGRGLRNFGVFLLGDSVKAFDERTNLILKWREQGGVLLMGYDMFRIFVTKQTSKKSAPMSKKVLQSTVPEGIDDDVHIKLRRALLDPGADLVICDEGHKIKCLKTSISNALNQVRTRRRIVLTGYPLQNNLVEYYCMVNFVRPNFLGTKNEFSAMFDRPIRNGQCIDSTRADVKRAQIKIHALVQMVKGFVQRRSSLLLKKILPENKEYVIVVRKTKMQHELYRAFVLFSKVDMYARKSVTYNPLKAHAVGTKIWNHPDLLYLTYMKKMSEQPITSYFHKNFQGNQVNHQRDQTYRQGNHQGDQAYHQGNHQGDEAYNQGNHQGDQAYHQGNHQGDQAYNQQYPQANQGYVQQYPQEDQGYGQQYPQMYIQNGQGYSNGLPQQNHQGYSNGFHQPNHQGYFQGNQGYPQGNQGYPQMNQEYPQGNQGYPQGSQGYPQMNQGYFQGHPVNNQQKNNVSEAAEKLRLLHTNQDDYFRIFDVDRELNQVDFVEEEEDITVELTYEWAGPILKNYIPMMMENSNKIILALDIIKETVKMGEKILLFSSSVLTLNLIERFLDSKEAPKMVDSEGREIKWSKKNTYCRFDGTTPACEREKLIEKFNNQKGFHLFLISTKAGSLGINLVSANRVIIMDASWNPCHDAQAVCRVYRYGQQKRTYVYRLVMYNSMEQAIFYRQISKHGLQQRVVDEVQCAAKVTTKQLEDLLKYDESLDIVSGEQETDDWEFDDSVLNEVVKTDGKLIAEKPFLHDSMITETEYGLSEEEKLEAELLYQQESEMHARNQNFNRISTGNSQNPEFEARLRELQYQNGALKGSLSDLRNMDYSDIGLNRTQFQIAPGSSSQIRYPTNNLNSLNNDRPLVHPLRANGALYKMSNNAVAKEVRSNFGTIFIHEDIVLPTTSNKMEFLKKGEHVRVMKMSGKTYLKRIDGGDILDATGTRYDPRMNMCNEVIQID